MSNPPSPPDRFEVKYRLPLAATVACISTAAELTSRPSGEGAPQVAPSLGATQMSDVTGPSEPGDAGDLASKKRRPSRAAMNGYAMSRPRCGSRNRSGSRQPLAVWRYTTTDACQSGPDRMTYISSIFGLNLMASSWAPVETRPGSKSAGADGAPCPAAGWPMAARGTPLPWSAASASRDGMSTTIAKDVHRTTFIFTPRVFVCVV